jgi:hypothetical protein
LNSASEQRATKFQTGSGVKVSLHVEHHASGPGASDSFALFAAFEVAGPGRSLRSVDTIPQPDQHVDSIMSRCVSSGIVVEHAATFEPHRCFGLKDEARASVMEERPEQHLISKAEMPEVATISKFRP